MINRRQFLQLAGLFGLAAVLPRKTLPGPLKAVSWPVLSATRLPGRQRSILMRIPRLSVEPGGNLLYLPFNAPSVPLPLAQTEWNREHSQDWDRLQTGHPWALVLHWFGDLPGAEHSPADYLYGFNSLRTISGYKTRTSAHALVGAAHPAAAGERVAILQTQLPHADGTPLAAAHLESLDYAAHAQQRQYFVRALYQLEYQDPRIHSLLQDWFDGPPIEPNWRSLAIEITGSNFDSPAGFPPAQQIANTLAVTAALMRRYHIPGSSLLGHLEIAIDSPDPGKKFIALIRCLLGIYALTTSDPELKELLFAQYLDQAGDPWQAVRTYFQFCRDFLVLSGLPVQVYEWEAQSSYWGLVDQLPGHTHTPLPAVRSFQTPLPGARPWPEAGFMPAHHHAGADLYLPASSPGEVTDVQLIAAGLCRYAGVARNHHPGLQAIFQHRQADGAEVLSLYGNLSSLADLQTGTIYPAGTVIGQLSSGAGRSFRLHFGIAYGSVWETTLHANPDVPSDATEPWIRERFMDPVEYMGRWNV